MRSYPTDSPRAAARLVALAMVADGHVGAAELEVLDAAEACERLRLGREAWLDVVRELCEDLLATSHYGWNVSCRVDSEMLAALLSEVRDPALRAEVIELCAAVACADDHVSENESIVLEAALAHWGRPAAHAVRARIAVPA